MNNEHKANEVWIQRPYITNTQIFVFTYYVGTSVLGIVFSTKNTQLSDFPNTVYF